MNLKETYIEALNAIDHDKCILILDEYLCSKHVNFDEAFDLVSQALSLSVNCATDEIWTEHAKTQIVRSSIELLSVHIIKNTPLRNQEKIAVICPHGEYHELGARVVSEAIRKEGYNVLFLGSSLPNKDIVKLVKSSDLKAIVFSISNFFTMHSINPVIDEINKIKPDLKIILGGQAINHNPSQIHGENCELCTTFDQLKEVLEAIK